MSLTGGCEPVTVTASNSAPVRQKIGAEGWFRRGIIALLAFYLVVVLALPLALMVFKSVQDRDGNVVGLQNYVEYFSTPALSQSIMNSVYVSTLTTVITVILAFVFAYGLHRSCTPFKGVFRALAMAPLLVPSLLSSISLIYLFGRQGVLTPLLFGHSIYGPIGIVVSSVFFTFPYAFLILSTALSLADQRHYEAAMSLRASRLKIFWTVTLPGARYGLISAIFVVFIATFTDFGVPKTIGGNFNVLPVDIYKQVIGQQNFEMGAVVSTLLLLPAVMAFFVDQMARKKQGANVSANSVPYAPTKNRRFDIAMLVYCSLISAFVVLIIITSQLAALIKFWPYNLSLSLDNYDFDKVAGGGWASFWNSLKLAVYTSVVGTVVIFVGAYIVEKTKDAKILREIFQFLAIMPMATPGMVLGLSYIFFFNHPANPLTFLYGTMAILVISTLTHYYTVAHLTMTTAIKQLDPEFESVSMSLGQPAHKVVRLVTIAICLPTILDIFFYLFVRAMTTVSVVIFLYSSETTLASIAMLNMGDLGDNAPAAAMGMMIFYVNLSARLFNGFASNAIRKHTQAWRSR